jgi:hypothetical protein
LEGDFVANAEDPTDGTGAGMLFTGELAAEK